MLKLGGMWEDNPGMEIHPAGEWEEAPSQPIPDGLLDTYGGRMRVEWDPSAKVTAFGPLSYFIHFLKTSGLWEEWVRLCPLQFTSNNAPSKEKILGTILLSILAGHKRYAHMTSVRADKVLPELLGMDGIASEDSVRRAFLKGEEADYTLWMDESMNTTFEPLLSEEWVLDIDGTVKTLYGKQEEARVGYNPTKPGRPSHVYHAYFIAKLRMVLNVDVHPGNEMASEFAHPGLFGWLDARPREQWPTLLRGDVAWGTEKTMCQAEERGLPFLFKLRQTEGVLRHLAELSKRRDWEFAGGGWRGVESELQLQGWTKKRRVVILRRSLARETVAVESESETGQPVLTGMVVIRKDRPIFEYAVLVTSLPEGEVLTIAQMYRDRADSENVFDELKNQWAWTGFTTHDLRRSQLMARIVALVFNWWSLYVRLAVPGRHTEAITSRPALVYGIAKQTKHGNQTKVTITSCHGKAEVIAAVLSKVNRFLTRFAASAEQLSRAERWARLLRVIFREFYPSGPVAALPAPV
jgi:hypothetical protein